MATISIERRAQVIVLGNEKGGSGKSTATMRLIVGLLCDSYQLGAIDLDARQATLSGYLAARQAFARIWGIDLPPPCSVDVRCDRHGHRIGGESSLRGELVFRDSPGSRKHPLPNGQNAILPSA